MIYFHGAASCSHYITLARHTGQLESTAVSHLWTVWRRLSVTLQKANIVALAARMEGASPETMADCEHSIQLSDMSSVEC